MGETVDLDRFSMFAATPIYKVGENTVFGLRRDSIIPDDSDSIVEVTKAWEDRLDLLSQEIYGTRSLWWAIAELNHIVDPLTQVKTGVELRIAKKERLMILLQNP